MDHAEELLGAIVIALARTWETKLPGFLAEFQTQLNLEVVNAPATSSLRYSLEELINRSRDSV